MARQSNDPVRHIVTFRMNDEEKKILDQLAEQSGQTVSHLMRHSAQLIASGSALTRKRLLNPSRD